MVIEPADIEREVLAWEAEIYRTTKYGQDIEPFWTEYFKTKAEAEAYKAVAQKVANEKGIEVKVLILSCKAMQDTDYEKFLWRVL